MADVIQEALVKIDYAVKAKKSYYGSETIKDRGVVIKIKVGDGVLEKEVTSMRRHAKAICKLFTDYSKRSLK